MVMKCTKYFFGGLAVLACAGMLMAGIGRAESVQKAGPQTVAAVPVEALASYGFTLVIARKAKVLIFSHQKHIIEVGLDCDSCHPDIFKRKRGAAKAAGDFTMKSMEQGNIAAPVMMEIRRLA